MQINCQGVLVDLSSPKIMGILNVTPDSFYDGGAYCTEIDYLKQTEKMLYEGATFIDVGGASSKPNAPTVTVSDEIKRTVPVIEAIVREFPEAILSIDTYNSEVARLAIQSGASIVNDISAGQLDDKMLQVVANLKVPYIMMHMRGNPQTMTSQTTYQNVIKEMLFYFSERVAQARKLGISDLIIDLGFGFAKTTEQNFEILKNIHVFETVLGLPILTGISRKSMIYKTLEIDVKNALNGTTALHMVALQQGTNILRVHDVKEAVECITLFSKL